MANSLILTPDLRRAEIRDLCRQEIAEMLTSMARQARADAGDMPQPVSVVMPDGSLSNARTSTEAAEESSFRLHHMPQGIAWAHAKGRLEGFLEILGSWRGNLQTCMSMTSDEAFSLVRLEPCNWNTEAHVVFRKLERMFAEAQGLIETTLSEEG